MTTVSATPSIRLRTPADILAAVPYLLGFHPADSLVLLGLRGRRLTFHARADLLPADAPPEAVAELGRQLVEVLRQQRVTAAGLVGYGPAERADPLLTEVRQRLEQAGLAVREALRATGGRYWSAVCVRPECCSPEGTPYDIAGSEIAALATFAGLAAMPDRGAVVRSLAGPTGAALAAIRRATEEAGRRLVERYDGGTGIAAVAAGTAALDDAVERYAGADRLTDDEVAWLSSVLLLTAVRDDAWRRIDADATAGIETHIQLWTDVLRRCDPRVAAPAGMLLSYATWRAGDGVRAAVAVDRALQADPAYSAAQLMAEVLQRGLSPSVLRHRRQRGGRRRRSTGRAHRRSTR